MPIRASPKTSPKDATPACPFHRARCSRVESSCDESPSEEEWPYLSGEKSVGVTNVDSTLPTSGPPASEVSRIDFHDGSLRKSFHDFFAASRLSCDST